MYFMEIPYKRRIKPYNVILFSLFVQYFLAQNQLKFRWTLPTMIAVVIEDEPFVLAVFRAVLEIRNFIVLPAQDAEAGLRCCTDSDRRIDVVVLDRYLRGRSDLQIVQEIRTMQPHVLLLLTSGTPVEHWDATDLNHLSAIPESCCAFLQKPFTAQKLMATVDELVGRRVALSTGGV